MSYSTRKDLKILFPSVDDFQLDAAAVTAFITRADNMIDAKLAKMYTVPFSGTPPIINDISKNLTLFYILQRHFTQQVPNQSDWVANLRAEVFETLDALAKDEITLTNSDGTVIEERTSKKQDLLSTTGDWTPIFDMRNPVFQNVDPDRLDAEDEADV